MELNFPTYNFRTQQVGEKTHIFDIVRQKYVVNTPEEWVRQHVIHFLIQERNFPKGLIAVEKGLTLNQRKKRFDLAVWNKKGQPCFLVECKAPKVKITQKTLEQIAQYNMVLRVPYLLVTNGLTHYCCQIDFEQENYWYLADIPFYEQVKIC